MYTQLLNAVEPERYVPTIGTLCTYSTLEGSL